MHTDPGHGHDHVPTEAERRAFAQMVLERENLQLLTVGIDVGSATSHLVVARVLFQRQGTRLAERFVPVRRAVEWRSPILLTPFLPDSTIDAARLSGFVRDCYARAGLAPADIDAGAVILTGEAVKRANARALDEALAGDSGRFVCATAGHNLEAILAAHGSGAAALSRARNACGLHVDIGGGTTKLALIDKGEILGVAALAVGGRVIAQDGGGSWSRVDEPARLAAAELGLTPCPSVLASEQARQRIGRRLAALVVDQISGGPADDLGRALQLTGALQRAVQPSYLTFSGGVAEYLFGRQACRYGDIAPDLAAAVTDQLQARVPLPVLDPGQRIRATVIGASQFSVQASGRTVHLSGQHALPVRNVPVVHLREPLPGQVDPGALARAFLDRAQRQDASATDAVALSFSWTGQVTHQRLLAVAQAIAAVAGSPAGYGPPLVIAVDADVAQSLGAILREETGLRRDLIVLDGLELAELDYIDVGEFIDPPGVLPVVIKSLLFG